MQILCITDQIPESEHSAVTGIFDGFLKKLADVHIVYFCRRTKSARKNGRYITIPHFNKRYQLLFELNRMVDLLSYDIVIVRNYFPVLGQILKKKDVYGFRVGFWESFPHSYRSLHQARVNKRAILRKSFEYRIRQYFEKKLIGKCDFYLPITDTYKECFHPEIDVSCLSLPMGVDCSRLPKKKGKYKKKEDDVFKFVYTGTVDMLRKIDIIVSAFGQCLKTFVFDIYTKGERDINDLKFHINDPRIRVFPPLPRAELFEKLMEYDIGIGLIPDTLLYRVSSPTKTLEYYSLGLPALLNGLPEYVNLFDENSAFFCDFEKNSITEAVNKILVIPKSRVREMGSLGRRIVMEKRDYRELSRNLYEFLKKQLEGKK